MQHRTSTEHPRSAGRPSRRRRLAVTCGILALTGAPCVAPGVAQGQSGGQGATIRATVKDTAGAPIIGAQLRIGTTQSAETNEAGLGVLRRVPVGAHWIQVRRIGYRPDSLRVVLPTPSQIDAPIVLRAVGATLATVRVVGRRGVTGPMAGFYQRQSQGLGTFLTHEEIVRRNPTRMTDLFSNMPGLNVATRGGIERSVRSRGARCAPVIRLDGQNLSAMEVDLDTFDPLSFDGIEVYRGGATVPTEFAVNQDISSSCGTIVLWTRVGQPKVITRGKQPVSAAARITALLDSLRVYAAADVDVPATLDSSRVVQPLYPDALYDAKTPGHVVVEFVVTESGEVDLDSFGAVTATDTRLVDAVRAVVGRQRFTPAQRKGRAVSQVVQQAFDFDPDLAARRKK